MLTRGEALPCALALALATTAWLSLACETRPAGDHTQQAQSSAPAEASLSSASRARTHDRSATTAGNGADRPEMPALPRALPSRSIGVFRRVEWLDGAERVAVFRHRDTPYIAVAETGTLRVFSAAGEKRATADARGAAQVLRVLSNDPERGVTLAVGRGMGRTDREAPASAILYRFDGRDLDADAVPLPPSTRAQIIAIAAASARADTVFIGAFESKYQASIFEATRRSSGGFAVVSRDRVRVPLDLDVGDTDGDGHLEVYVARPYGEDKDQPGDVFLWRGPGERELLPTTRGARAVAVHGPYVIMADGWHRDYGHKASALITRARHSERGWQADILVSVAGRHGYDRLDIGDVDKNGTPDIVAAGNGPAILIPDLAPVTDAARTLGTVDAWDVAIGDVYGDERQEVVIAGPSPGIWQLE